jgi:hypothetical protein
MFVSGSALLMYALAAMIAVLVGRDVAKWAMSKDTEIEDRRRAANKLASHLRVLGLSKIPEFLEDYGVGDYSGMADKLKRLVDLFTSGEEHVIAEFDQVYSNVLSAKLKTPEGRTMLAAMLADASNETDPTVVGDAPKAGIVKAAA